MSPFFLDQPFNQFGQERQVHKEFGSKYNYLLPTILQSI